MNGQGWNLAEPIGLLILLLCPLPWLRRRRTLTWPTLDGFRQAKMSRRRLLRHLPALLVSLAFACLAVAVARPRTLNGITRIAGKGVAIVVALDRSSSMTASDSTEKGREITRLDAARSTFARFLEGRPDDLVGLIAFARYPVRLSPPTLDHSFVLDALRSIRPARIDEDGTNLGYTLAFGLGDLRDAPSPKKVLVVLTDGRDSPASVEGLRPIVPEDAARLARQLGITVHTIAVGSEKKNGDAGPDLDRLQKLAELGGGQAFRASDPAEMEQVFAAINRLEKSPLAATIRARYREDYPYWVGAAVVLLIFEECLRGWWLRRLP